MIRPPILPKNAHVRVIAPSLSLAIISKEVTAIAQSRFEAMGFTLSFGKHAFEINQFQSSSIASRIADLHDAFTDNSVHGVIAALGGYNCNQLLSHIDYDLIKAHPKFFCGYSDLTILLNALAHKSNLTTFYGPHFSTFGQKKLDQYETDYFLQACRQDQPFDIFASERWSNDTWYADQENRRLIKNEGYWILREGSATGLGVGGHLGTLCLLQGSAYLPTPEGKILLLEEDSEPANPKDFDRNLHALLAQPGAQNIAGILIGRFEYGYHMSRDLLEKIIASANIPAHIAIIANVDFGHTEPHCTLPIGGTINIVANKNSCSISVL